MPPLHTRTFSLIARAVGVAFLVACASPANADWVKFGSGGWGSKWDDPVHPNPATVTWGFVPDGTAMYSSFPLTPEVVGTSNITQLRNQVDGVYGAGAFNAALQRAFATWHAVSGITFVGPDTDPGLQIGAPTATTPDIRVSAFNPVPFSGFSWVAAVGYGPPGNDLFFPDAVAGDIVFNLAQTFIIPTGSEGAPIGMLGNDVENLFLHELGHAAMGLGHPLLGPGEVMYVGANCCNVINREPSPDDIAGAQSVYGLSSIPACGNGIDDDGDGTKDAADPGCANTSDIDERSPTLPCDNGVDDDGDGRKDFDPATKADAPAFAAGRGDKGCFDSRWLVENPRCQNGLNDDAAIGTDFDAGVSILGAGNGDANGSDPQCANKPWRDNENPDSSCGIGFEIALVLFPLSARWRRRS